MFGNGLDKPLENTLKMAKFGTFDVTLLTDLLRNISGLPCPATGWNTIPPDSDTVDLLKRILQESIKQLRNQVFAHAVSAQVNNATFDKLWKDVSQALVDFI